MDWFGGRILLCLGRRGHAGGKQAEDKIGFIGQVVKQLWLYAEGKGGRDQVSTEFVKHLKEWSGVTVTGKWLLRRFGKQFFYCFRIALDREQERAGGRVRRTAMLLPIAQNGYRQMECAGEFGLSHAKSLAKRLYSRNTAHLRELNARKRPSVEVGAGGRFNFLVRHRRETRPVGIAPRWGFTILHGQLRNTGPAHFASLSAPI
jgi:hypothetical protein